MSDNFFKDEIYPLVRMGELKQEVLLKLARKLNCHETLISHFVYHVYFEVNNYLISLHHQEAENLPLTGKFPVDFLEPDYKTTHRLYHKFYDVINIFNKLEESYVLEGDSIRGIILPTGRRDFIQARYLVIKTYLKALQALWGRK